MFNCYIRKLRLIKIKKTIKKWSFEITYDVKQNKQNKKKNQKFS